VLPSTLTLDTAGEARVREALRQGRTTILIAHRLTRGGTG
jgi:ABC-type multidrug transport system fused ATPase/permease subunit